MTELAILPIPGDPAGKNAERFLNLQANILRDNGVNDATLEEEYLDSSVKEAVNSQDRAFRDSYKYKRDEFIGVFESVGEAKKLVGGLELRPVLLSDLQPYMLPLERVALRRSMETKANSMGVFALVAEEGYEQINILTMLLETAIQMSLSSESVYIGLPQVDPARQVVISKGFEPKRPGSVYGIPYTLFERQNT